MYDRSKFLVAIICLFIIAFKCASAAAFVEHGLGRSQSVDVIPSKTIYLSSSATQEIKGVNQFHFSSHVLGFLEGFPKSDLRNTGFRIVSTSTYSNLYLEIISSRIFRPPRLV
jgi:hypothetical protein